MPAGRPRALDTDIVLELKKDGYTHKEIAEMFNVSTVTVGASLKEHREEYRDKVKGYQGRKINLTEEEIKYILSLRARGYFMKEIAGITGYNPAYISKVIKKHGGK